MKPWMALLVSLGTFSSAYAQKYLNNQSIISVNRVGALGIRQ